MWTEVVDGPQITERIWMRTSSLAERHWNNEYYENIEKNYGI